jgi:pre-mRNA-splicing factor ISY1
MHFMHATDFCSFQLSTFSTVVAATEAPFLSLSTKYTIFLYFKMARPEEMAQNMLNKWVRMREQGNAPLKPSFAKRPYLASLCLHLDDAERYRRQIIREISTQIQEIQNPGLGEHAIRDLNDSINKKLREKHHWNKRIKELGGPDYRAIEKKQQLEHGEDNLHLQSGYRYFGAAKDLPGVKELFAKQRAQHLKRKRVDIYKNITPDYYGWREEEDGVLLELEQEATARNEERFQERIREEKRLKQEQGVMEEQDDESSSDEEEEEWTSEAVVPSQDVIAQAILERKKQALLEKFS